MLRSIALLTVAALGLAGVRPLHCAEAPAVERSAAIAEAPAPHAGGPHTGHGGVPASEHEAPNPGEGPHAADPDAAPGHEDHDESHGARLCVPLSTCAAPALPEVALGASPAPVVRQTAPLPVTAEPSLHDLATDPPPPRRLPPGERS